MPSCPQVFNISHLQKNRRRAQGNFDRHRFILDWCEEQIRERLTDICRSFKQGLVTNPHTSSAFVASLNLETRSSAEEWEPNDDETLKIPPESLDFVISLLDLHRVNDLPGFLLQIRRALKPDGLFIGCLFGGETLHELRESLLAAELEVLGGGSPRVFPFIDKPQMGSLLQRAGFALPVVDSDVLTVSYLNIFYLMADLRGMGERNALNDRRKTFTPSSLFAKAAEIYATRFPDIDDRIRASFEVIFVIGWSPHESQQTPLKPGSGQISLNDVL